MLISIDRHTDGIGNRILHSRAAGLDGSIQSRDVRPAFARKEVPITAARPDGSIQLPKGSVLRLYCSTAFLKSVARPPCVIVKLAAESNSITTPAGANSKCVSLLALSGNAG